MSELDLAVGVDGRWVPLLLDPEPDVDAWAAATAAQVLDLRVGLPADAGEPHADECDRVASLLAGLSRRAMAGALVAEGTLTAAAWALAPEAVFTPLAVATLRAQVLPAGADDEVAVAAVVGPDAPRHGHVEVEPLDTPSGPALRVTSRPVSPSGDASRVDEQQAVLWRRPEDELLLVLSTWWTDLVQAGRWSSALDDLARLVHARVVP